jgi:ParB/RepB/Spo0J family partition protein
MNIQEVPITKIRPNPFCPRKKSGEAMSKEAIESFAKEIKDLGWWGGALKARQKNGIYELAFGSRRLQALKSLGHKTIVLDVEALTNEQMKLLMAAENFQRHALTEEEKLVVWKEIKALMGGSTGKSAKMLGISGEVATAYNKALEYADKGFRSSGISARALLEADSLGGEEMVRVAAKKGLGAGAITRISAEINRAAAKHEAPKEKLVAAAKKGRIASADDVKDAVREIKQEAFNEKVRDAKKKHPPDLIKVIETWCKDLPPIIEQIGEVASLKSYADYIMDADPKLAGKFRGILRDLIRVAAKLEENILPRLEA